MALLPHRLQQHSPASTNAHVSSLLCQVLLNYMHAYHDTGYYQPPVPCADIMHAGHTSCLPARHSPGAITAAQTVPLHEAVTGTYDWQDWHIQVPRIRHAPFLEKRRKHLAARAFGLDCKLSSCCELGAAHKFQDGLAGDCERAVVMPVLLLCFPYCQGAGTCVGLGI